MFLVDTGPNESYFCIHCTSKTTQREFRRNSSLQQATCDIYFYFVGLVAFLFFSILRDYPSWLACILHPACCCCSAPPQSAPPPPPLLPSPTGPRTFQVFLTNAHPSSSLRNCQIRGKSLCKRCTSLALARLALRRDTLTGVLSPKLPRPPRLLPPPRGPFRVRGFLCDGGRGRRSASGLSLPWTSAGEPISFSRPRTRKGKKRPFVCLSLRSGAVAVIAAVD